MKCINLLMLFCLSFCLLIPPASADDDTTEYKIKAGYLYNFTKFVTWPQDHPTTFNVCILGTDPFGALIDPIEQRTAFGLPIKLFRFNTPDKAQFCHIVFVCADQTINNARSMNHAGLTLLVGEGDAFAKQRGGMIGFINRDDKIKLQINVQSLQQSHLTISAKLLEVAEIVKGGPHE
jgi:hypothetical protein